MILVVDANVLFSAVIKDGLTRAILLFSGYEFYAPEFSVEEFRKHLPELRKKTGLPEAELVELFDRLLQTAEIKLVPFEDFKSKHVLAKQISPDEDDVAYLALALHLNCPLWSNDSLLKEQGAVKVFTTKELLLQLKQ